MPAFAAGPPSLLNPNVLTFQNNQPNIDGASGAIAQSIKLDLPPGRGGIEPVLSLDYNSNDTRQDSEVGYGWSLPIPSISRVNKTGTQDLYGADSVFTTSLDGELTFTTTQIPIPSPEVISYIIVAGGGGGGNGAQTAAGGGGGAGGLLSGSTPIALGTYSVTVGGGGSIAGSGADSVAIGLRAFGGGAGGNANGIDPSGGGSGGGGRGQGFGGGGFGAGWVQGQGNRGGNSTSFSGGGGGGASTSGSNTPLNSVGGSGGSGVANFITGTSIAYAGGGGGGGLNGGGGGGAGGGGAGAVGAAAGDPSAGLANTGGGGGGGGVNFFHHSGAIGGSGIVILSYPTAEAGNFLCGGTTSTSGTNTLCTFTSNGTFSIINTTFTFVDSTTGYYLPRTDNGSFHQYTYATSTDSWTMFDKKGNEYFFGSTAESKQFANTTPSQVYKWMLDRVQDTNGNYVRYAYAKDGNQLYPSNIFYTGRDSTDGPMTVSFATSTRPDAVSSFATGFKVVTNWRISKITAAVSGTTVREYNLGYTAGNNGSRSLLSAVQKNGWNDSGAEASEPAMSFNYLNTVAPFVRQGVNLRGSAGGGCNGDTWVAADINADGVNDLTTIQFNTGGGTDGWMLGGGGGDATLLTPTPPSGTYWVDEANGCLRESGSRLLDVNADGRADIVGQNSGGQGGVFLNNHRTSADPYSWTATTTYSGTIPVLANSGFSAPVTTGLFGDLNGTGLPSYELALPTENGAYLANGSAWNQATTTIFQAPMRVPVGTPDCTGIQFADVNGDGLDDWVYTDRTNTYALLNTGRGWEPTPDPNYTIATSTLFAFNGQCFDRGMRFVDVNGDGLPDFVRSYNVQGRLPELGNFHFVNLNTGHGWATSTAYNLPDVIFGAAQVGAFAAPLATTDSELFNFNGNGQQAQDVLSTITYPTGGSTDVAYEYSTQSGTNPNLPYNLLVATQLVNHDGKGSNEASNFSYKNGLQYLPTNVFDRKFAGFGSVTNSTSQSTVVTYFSQGTTSLALVAGDRSDGPGVLNHPYRKDTFTPSGALVQSLFYQYVPIKHGKSEFAGLTRQVEQDYATGGSHIDKASDYTYSTTTDDIIKSVDYGQVVGNSDGTFSTSTASTPRTVKYTYAANTAVNLSVLSGKTLASAAGATTTDSKYFYDNLPFGGVNLGNQTKQADWVGSLTYASSTKAYNAYGLVATSTDPDGNETTYSYDPFNLYPTTATNALGQSTIYTYNYSNGKSLQTTNPNGGISVNSYDGLGRLTKKDESDPLNPSSLLTKAVIAYTDSTSTPSVAHETDYLNSASTTDAYDYYDGLRRLIQERKSTETNGTYVVTDRKYDLAGNLAAVSLPYFSSGSAAFSSETQTVNALVVAGGGGGAAGGGGGGGVISDTAHTVTSGTGYTVTIGGGGSGTNASSGANGSNGQNSVFDSITAVGGGGGGNGAGANRDGSNGGSGGGAGYTGGGQSTVHGSATQGNSGGGTGYGFNGADGRNTGQIWSGGGGGAGSTGHLDPNDATGSTGGSGFVSTISGASIEYAGGGGGNSVFGTPDSTATGGGGAGIHASDGVNGTAHTGGGAGGAGYSGTYHNGGNGGSGIVILSYPTANASNYTCGGTTTTSGSNTICTFTFNGTFTVGTIGGSTATTTTSLYMTYTYDPLNRAATITNAVGSTANVYSGWTTTTTDPKGNVKDSILDAFGNLAQVVEHTGASNANTQYAYDSANNLFTMTDALGNIRTFTYDGIGRRTSATDLHAPADSTFGTMSYSFDNAGNEVSRTDPNGNIITHTYDPLNRMLTESVAGEGKVTDTYDSCKYGIGKLCTASSTSARSSYAYDVLGRTTVATTTIAGTDYPLAYVYDRQGDVLNMTAPDGSTLNYAYNGAGLTNSVSRTSTGATTPIALMSNFLPTGAFGNVNFVSLASTTYTYDPAALYRLIGIKTLGTGSAAFSSETQTVNALVVAGGGGGAAGGGGGGGVISDTAHTVTSGTGYTVTIGGGGSGIAANSGSAGGPGQNSSFDTMIAIGGGGGGAGAGSNRVGQNGGSGGGGGYSGGGDALTLGSATQGNSGGGTGYGFNGADGRNTGQIWSGGGGGAGSAGHLDPNDATGSTGGSGFVSTISGASIEYAGGGGGNTVFGTQDSTATGGGGAGVHATDGGAGTSNTGGGGGGAGYSGVYHNGGNGGSGIVILSYPTANASKYTCGGTTTTSGSNTVCTFTSNGAFTVTGSSAPTSPRSISDTGKLQDLNFTYDPDGNIVSRIDNSDAGLGEKVAYTYDALNRLTKATAVGGYSPYDHNFAYDALGNIVSGPAGAYSYGGNADSNYANPDAVTQIFLTGTSSPMIGYDNSAIVGNGTPASSLTFSYTDNDNTNGVILVSISEATSSPCTTDAVTGVTDNGVSLSDLGYYISNSSIGALKTYYGFAPAKGTHNIVVSASNSCILYAAAASYTGVKQSDMPNASGTGNPLSDSGAVNPFQPKTAISGTSAWMMFVGIPSSGGAATAGLGTTIRGQQSGTLYQADSNGPVSGTAGLSLSMPTATNWLANYFSISPAAAASTTSSTSYMYDNNGNLVLTTTGATTTTYIYDYANRLTSLGVNGATTTYAYDAGGNRVSQTAGNTTTVYPDQYFSLITTSGAGTSTAATSTLYAYDGSTLLATIDQPLINGTATGSPITRYIHPDNLGSTQATSDESGHLAQYFDYAPYGSVLASTNKGSAATVAKQYIGQFSDPSGLSYLNARYYNGGQGQFLSQDPVFLIAPNQQNLLDPQSLNSYSYSDDNPIVKSDPSGKCFEDLCVGEFAAASLYAQYLVAASPIIAEDYANFSDKLNQGSLAGTAFAGLGLALDVFPGGTAIEKATYTVYQGVDAAGVVRYIGRTSRDLVARVSEHLRAVGSGREDLIYSPIGEAGALTKKQAGIVEQANIDLHGLQKNGGTLLNKINSISVSSAVGNIVNQFTSGFSSALSALQNAFKATNDTQRQALQSVVNAFKK